MVNNELLQRCIDVADNLNTFADGERDELGTICREAVAVIADLLDRLGEANARLLIP